MSPPTAASASYGPLFAPRVEAEVHAPAGTVGDRTTIGPVSRIQESSIANGRISTVSPRSSDALGDVVGTYDHRHRFVHGDRPRDLGVHRPRGFQLIRRVDALRNIGRPGHERALVRLGLGGHPTSAGRRHGPGKRHDGKLACAHAAHRRPRAVGRTRFELGSVGRRRPARHAEPHHARRRPARAWPPPANGRVVLARDPVRPDRTAVGQRPHARAHQPRAAHPHRQRRVHRATARLHDERRLVPHGLAGRRRTGTRSRTWATSGKLWNDTPSAVVTADAGAARLGIEHFGPVATRGLLLDIARGRGVDHFDDNYAITGDDLEAAAAAADVAVEPGDAVLVRTGQMHFLRAGDKQRYSMPSPGLSTQSIAWIRDHDVARSRPTR